MTTFVFWICPLMSTSCVLKDQTCAGAVAATYHNDFLLACLQNEQATHAELREQAEQRAQEQQSALDEERGRSTALRSENEALLAQHAHAAAVEASKPARYGQGKALHMLRACTAGENTG